MPETHEGNNPQYPQPPKVRFDEEVVQRSEEERRRKVEEDKARKDKARPRWSPEAWAAAREARALALAGKGPPPPRFPIIVNDFMTPEKIQKICGLPSPPDVEWLTTAPYEPDCEPERLQYCAVQGRKAYHQIMEATQGEDIVVLFQDKERAAWLAFEKDPEDEAGSVERGEQNERSKC